MLLSHVYVHMWTITDPRWSLITISQWRCMWRVWVAHNTTSLWLPLTLSTARERPCSSSRESLGRSSTLETSGTRFIFLHVSIQSLSSLLCRSAFCQPLSICITSSTPPQTSSMLLVLYSLYIGLGAVTGHGLALVDAVCVCGMVLEGNLQRMRQTMNHTERFGPKGLCQLITLNQNLLCDLLFAKSFAQQFPFETIHYIALSFDSISVWNHYAVHMSVYSSVLFMKADVAHAGPNTQYIVHPYVLQM